MCLFLFLFFAIVCLLCYLGWLTRVGWFELDSDWTWVNVKNRMIKPNMGKGQREVLLFSVIVLI